MKALLVPQLRQLAAKLGLPKDGRKADLIKRCSAAPPDRLQAALSSIPVRPGRLKAGLAKSAKSMVTPTGGGAAPATKAKTSIPAPHATGSIKSPAKAKNAPPVVPAAVSRLTTVASTANKPAKAPLSKPTTSAAAAPLDDYDCMLNLTNVAQNHNSFYILQLLYTHNQYTVYSRWGRVTATLTL
jgi:hypothetical protein